MPGFSPALQDVIRVLDACADHTPATLAAALDRPIGLDDVASWIRFDAANYTRNLVTRTDRWELRVLCWRPGQLSSLHGHGQSACAFRILRGGATETILGSRDRRWAPGDVAPEGGAGFIHQVGNHDSDALLTLHAYSPALAVDAPSPRDGHNVVIVGGGFAGITAAFHLLRRGDRNLRVTLVERGPWLGRGIAYGVDSEVFRLNVPASSMSIDPDQPEDFVRWVGAEATPDAFLSRAQYGAYVVARFADAVRASAGKLRVIRGEVHSIDDDGIELVDGRRFAAASVVLATGLEAHSAQLSLPQDPRIVDAWDECAVAALPRDGRLLVLGSGLTALDVISFLNVHGFRGSATIVSRHGLLPAPHAAQPATIAALPDAVVADAPRELHRLIRWVRTRVADAAERGVPWQHAIDSLRPHVGRLWRGLSPRDRVRFVRDVRPFWDVLRHRAPADVHALVESWCRARRLDRIAGAVLHCVPTADGLEVELRLTSGGTRSLHFDAIVCCTGPAIVGATVDAPLIQNMLETGRAVVDPAGLGIITDERGGVVQRDNKPSDRLFALGALRRASTWETTAAPEISSHAAELAQRICGQMDADSRHTTRTS